MPVRIASVVLTSCLASGAALTTPAVAEERAADPGRPAPEASDAEPRVVLQIEMFHAAPRNLSLDYAFFDPGGSLSGGGEVQTLAIGGRPETRLRFDWRPAGTGGASVGATLWEFDGAADAATGDRPAMIGALLASPDFAIGRSLVDSAEATTRVRGTLLDADLSWPAGPAGPAVLRFCAGLRAFRFEQLYTVIYRAVRSGNNLEEFVTARNEARGLGPRGGVSFGYRLGRRVLVGGEIALALAIGEIEAEAGDTAFINGSLDRATRSQRPGTRRTFTHLDGAFRVEVLLAPRVALVVSHVYSAWSGVAVGERFVDDVSQNTALTVEQDVVFVGSTAGLRLIF
jgi:hypothetical protein